MAKEMVSMEDVRECFRLSIESLDRQCESWKDSLESSKDYYCKPDGINAGTSLINVSNVVSQAGEIKALLKAKEHLNYVLGLIESASKRGETNG